jgi:hypothetical protein
MLQSTPSTVACKRHLIRDDDDYLLEIDEYSLGPQHFHLVHFSVKRWAPSALKKIRRHWPLFRAAIPQPLYTAGGEVVDDKWCKFIASLGFKPHSTIVTNGGEQRTLYVNDG